MVEKRREAIAIYLKKAAALVCSGVFHLTQTSDYNSLFASYYSFRNCKLKNTYSWQVYLYDPLLFLICRSLH